MPKQSEISQEKYLQLIGLLTLAQHHMRSLEEIEKSAGQLIGMKKERFNDFGHLTDAIYTSSDGFDIDEVLARMNIIVSDRKR